MSENKNQFYSLVESKKKDLWDIKANYLKENSETYFKRALLSISQDTNLMKLSKDQKGAWSILKCISDALQMGLQIGGHLPQAYIVGMGDNATLIPTAEGYKYIALSEPAILKKFFVHLVYEGEHFSLNYATGEVDHRVDTNSPRENIIGAYCMITDLNGNNTADFMSKKEIDRIRDNHSKYYKAFKKGPWVDDYEMMCLKTATKRFLKPYASLKEGLLMALSLREDEVTEIPQNGKIEDRAGSILDNAIDVTEMSAEVEKPEKPEPTPPPPPKAEKKKDDNNDIADIFKT